jgi:hypothetical protein
MEGDQPRIVPHSRIAPGIGPNAWHFYLYDSMAQPGTIRDLDTPCVIASCAQKSLQKVRSIGYWRGDVSAGRAHKIEQRAARATQRSTPIPDAQARRWHHG